MGVEEEYFLVDPVSWAPKPAADRVAARAAVLLRESVSVELSQYQIEIKTSPCSDAARLRDQLGYLRSLAAAAAAEEGLRICATGTPVVGGSGPIPVGEHPRYRAGVEQYRGMLEDFAVCSVHVHIHLPDREVAVLVANHLRPWLPLLLALSANSPFHQGRDTGYADWRAVIRSRFPCLGPPPYVESLRHHQELAAALAESEAMLAADLPFWDVRANPRLPTLEIRSMDVVADLDDTVALGAIIRAFVVTATERVRRGDPGPRVCSELLRAAYWRAARDGCSGKSFDLLTGAVRPVPAQATDLFNRIRPALDESGDTPLVAGLLQRLSARGSGAERQRACVARHGALTAVVADQVALTSAGWRTSLP